MTMAVALPTLVAGVGWGDWKGGCVYAAFLRLTFVHQARSLLNPVCITDGH